LAHDWKRVFFIDGFSVVAEVVHDGDFLDALFAHTHTNFIESRVSVML